MRAGPIHLCAAVVLLLICGLVYHVLHTDPSSPPPRRSSPERVGESSTGPRVGLEPTSTEDVSGSTSSPSITSPRHGESPLPAAIRHESPAVGTTTENGGNPTGVQDPPPTPVVSSTGDRASTTDANIVDGTSTAPRKNLLKQEMILIPAGEFMMGLSSTSEIGLDDFLNYEHRATTAAFWIDKYEVTNAMYEEFVLATGYRPNDTNPVKLQRYLAHWVDGKPPDGTENQPVRWVSFDDARAYAAWAGKRLPTHEEWEKAARGTDGRTYPWGNDWDDRRRVILSMQDSHDESPVDADAYANGASPYDVFNMEGNICEWTCTEAKVHHPESPIEYITRIRVSPIGTILALPPQTRHPSVGFRCARDAASDTAQPR